MTPANERDTKIANYQTSNVLWVLLLTYKCNIDDFRKFVSKRFKDEDTIESLYAVADKDGYMEFLINFQDKTQQTYSFGSTRVKNWLVDYTTQNIQSIKWKN